MNALPEKRKRFSEAALSEMRVLSKGDLKEITEQFIRTGRFQGLEQGELPLLTNASRKKIEEVLKPLLAQKKVILYDREKGALIHAASLAKAREEILSTLTRYHQDNPLKGGLLKEELRSRTTGSCAARD